MLNKKALAAAVGVPAQYQIERSLRFNGADSANLSRTPGSAGNRKTWTYSVWLKRSALGVSDQFFAVRPNLTPYFLNFFDSSNRLTSEGGGHTLISTAVFRDVSAWYHIVIAWDTTQATASNRLKMYVNGNQITAFDTATYPSQNYDGEINNTASHTISGAFNSEYYDGYMAEINFIDGQALTPSSFGETDADTGIWKPKAFSGTYGTNGFYLDFSDNSGTTSTTLGKDYSGNSNNWTPNNFSVTAGTGNDSLVDTPTPYGTDTGAGGEVRGNYATWNPLRNAATLANGNLDISSSSNGVNSFATMGLTSGKWYWEVTVTSVQNTYYPGIGVNTNLSLSPSSQSGADAVGYMYLANGQKFNNDVASSYGNSYTANDVIGVALDMDAGKIWFSKNGTFQNSGSPTGGTNEAFSGITGTAVPVVISWTNSTCVGNFGQRPFAYTAPSGFKALCTTNLPTPTIGATATTRADDYFNTVLYTGTGSSQSITGVGFQPDLVWIKERNGVADHALYDAVRGVQKQIESNTTDAETTETTGLTAFGTDGFTVGSLAQLNTNTDTYVAWNWKANGAGSSNTNGTITSTVSVNSTSKFSIVKYTGNGSKTATVGHGLGAEPGLILQYELGGGDWWHVWTTGLSGNSYNLFLNATNVERSNEADGQLKNNGSTTFGFDSTTSNVDAVNQNGVNYIAYCFAPVAGFSAFGKYTGNGSTNGPFVYTGFRPAFVLYKRSDATGYWYIYDAKRNSYNVCQDALYPNTSDAQTLDSNNSIDIVSNGFKVRANSSGTYTNANGGTYVYACFAENPFKYSLAR